MLSCWITVAPKATATPPLAAYCRRSLTYDKKFVGNDGGSTRRVFHLAPVASHQQGHSLGSQHPRPDSGGAPLVTP